MTSVGMRARLDAFLLRARGLAAEGRRLGLEISPLASPDALEDYAYAHADVTMVGTDRHYRISTGGAFQCGDEDIRPASVMPVIRGWRHVSRAARIRNEVNNA